MRYQKLPIKLLFSLSGLSLLTLLSGCRQDMHDQPKYKPLRQSVFFADQRQSRPLLPNTVARGELHEATEFYSGKSQADAKVDLEYFPMPINREVIERGHQRFDVFCSPCHGKQGNGAGMIVKRGFKAPPSYHIQRLRDAPVGHFYDVITNGYGSMYNYAAQIPPRDRWAIISYIRALQYSQNVPAAEVTSAMRAKLDAPPAQAEGDLLDMPNRNPIHDRKSEYVASPAVPARQSEIKSSPNTPNLPQGAPATPMSPTPPKSPSNTGADKK